MQDAVIALCYQAVGQGERRGGAASARAGRGPAGWDVLAALGRQEVGRVRGREAPGYGPGARRGRAVVGGDGKGVLVRAGVVVVWGVGFLMGGVMRQNKNRDRGCAVRRGLPVVSRLLGWHRGVSRPR